MGTAPAAGPVMSAPSIATLASDSLHWSHWWYLESARFLDIRKNIQGPVTPDGRSVVDTAPRAPSRHVVQTQVVPALLDLVKSERSDPIVAAALVALGRLADEPVALHQRAVAAVSAHLKSSNPSVRESAIIALGLFGTPECNRRLFDLVEGGQRAEELRDTTTITLRTRAFAAHALGLAAVRIDDVDEEQRIALAMIDVLEGEVSGMADLPVAAVSTLGLLELPSRTAIPSTELRSHAHVDHVLSSRHLARYLLPLTTRAAGNRADRSATLRAHACVALARTARDADAATRASSVHHLVTLGSSRQEHINLRAATSVALGEIARAGEAPADAAARKHLLHVGRKGQPIERRFAWIAVASAMGRSGAGEEPMAGTDDVRRGLAVELARGRSGELGWTSLALGMLDDSLHAGGMTTSARSQDTLSAMALKKRSDDDSAALGLGLALATRKTDRADRAGKRLMAELEQTSTPELRGNLLLALGLVEHQDAVKVFREELENSRTKPVLLWSAAVALGLMGEPVSKDLVRMLGESKSAPERIGISAALGQVGASKAVTPLLELIHGENRPDPMRAAAVEALGAVCDLDRLPWRDPIAHALPYFATTATLSTNGLGLLERPW